MTPRFRTRRVVTFGLVAFAVAGACVACSSTSKLALGADCTQATECEDGLACVPLKGGKRVCSNDLEGLGRVPERPAPDDGSDASDDAYAASDGPGPTADAKPPARDANAVDARPPPPPRVDAGPDSAADSAPDPAADAAPE